jgi:hypothetical protein
LPVALHPFAGHPASPPLLSEVAIGCSEELLAVFSWIEQTPSLGGWERGLFNERRHDVIEEVMFKVD